MNTVNISVTIRDIIEFSALNFDDALRHCPSAGASVLQITYEHFGNLIKALSPLRELSLCMCLD
jgi:hypothetical protein